MSRMHARFTPACLVLVGMLAASSCAASPGAQAPASSDAPAEQRLGSVRPVPPDGEVTATGTVMDVDGEVELCLGAIMESYPPQCDGITLNGWSWEGVDGSEASQSIRWGAYAVNGTFDGTAFTLTESPVMLALFDPMPAEDPTDGLAGSTGEAELNGIIEEVSERFVGDDLFLGAYPDRGYAWIDVIWDDGTLQRAADDEFGSGVVVIRSRLSPAA